MILALVLSGGGFLGSIQVGCLEALLKAGILPDLVVGTSVGALNGALFASEPTLNSIEELKRIWLLPKTTNLLGEANLMVALRVILGSQHIFSGEGLRTLIAAKPGIVGFEQLALPLFVVATELETGRKVVFSSGPLSPALLASTAVPGVLPSVRINGKEYVDGAVTSHCSVETAFEQGATTAIVIHCPHLLTSRGYGASKPLIRASDIALRRMCELELEKFRGRPNTFILEPLIDAEAFKLREEMRTSKLLEDGRLWTEDYLRSAEGARLLVVTRDKAPAEEFVAEKQLA